MSLSAVSPVQDSKIKPLHVLIMGKCISVRKTNSGKSFSHIVICPSKDEFSYPQTIEFYGEQKLFDVDDSVVQVCQLTGKADNYIGKDADGEPKKIRTARLTLWAIQAS